MTRIMVVLVSFLFLSVPLLAQNHNFGLGVQLGEPTGLNAKLWTGNTNAVDFGLAWSFEGRDEMVMQADYVWHSFDVFPVSSGELPLYFGIGGRAILRDDPVLGARIPVGIAYMFESFPLDVFAEIAPILNLLPSTSFDLGGGFGVRFRF
ncbi:MAG TPA: hypothetical protein VIY47_02605 [Ignavibacteriaceae bacterium]